MAKSKKLGHDDTSGFEFVKRALGDHVTAAVNFDRLQKDPTKGYIIFEFLKCEEEQSVTPYTSHPNRYWNKNASKFLSLWRVSQDLGAVLYLVNYAEADTKYADQVLLMEVQDIDENGIVKESVTKHTMASFSKWFVDVNNRCLEAKDKLVLDIYRKKSRKDLGAIRLRKGKHAGETIEAIYGRDAGYLEWHSKTDYEYSKAVLCYLEKQQESGMEN